MSTSTRILSSLSPVNRHHIHRQTCESLARPASLLNIPLPAKISTEWYCSRDLWSPSSYDPDRIENQYLMVLSCLYLDVLHGVGCIPEACRLPWIPPPNFKWKNKRKKLVKSTAKQKCAIRSWIIPLPPRGCLCPAKKQSWSGSCKGGNFTYYA